MRKLKVMLGFIVLGFFACQKVETPPASEGNPVFSIDGKLDGNDLNITAGENDYYLFTSHEIDEFNVRSFVATFAKIDCLDECQDTFRIKIRDVQPNASNVNDALSVGNYNYRKIDLGSETIIADTTIIYQLNFNAGNSTTSSIGNITYQWEIDTFIATVSSPIFNYLFIADVDANIPVKLAVSDAICSSSKSTNISLTNMEVIQSCNIDLSINTSPLETMLTANSTGEPPFDYSWNTGETTPSIVIDSYIQNVFSVQVIDNNNCESNASVTIDSLNTSIQCLADFSVQGEAEMLIDSTTISIPGDSLQLSKVIIEYVDENGNFYATDIQEQPTNSNFLIQSVAEFMDNENGEKTKQLEIEFNAILFNQNGLPALSLTQGKGKIAVAYPD